jgi:hypothetical protein
MHTLTQGRHWQAVMAFRLAFAVLLSALLGTTVRASADGPPNILFFIMDDVGIDQMQVFGYGGEAGLPAGSASAASAARGSRLRAVLAPKPRFLGEAPEFHWKAPSAPRSTAGSQWRRWMSTGTTTPTWSWGPGPPAGSSPG